MPREIEPDELFDGLSHAFQVSVRTVAGGLLDGSNLSAGAASIRAKTGGSYLVVVMGGDRERVEGLAFKIKDLVESARGDGEKAQSTVRDSR